MVKATTHNGHVMQKVVVDKAGLQPGGQSLANRALAHPGPSIQVYDQQTDPRGQMQDMVCFQALLETTGIERALYSSRRLRPVR